MDSPQSISVFSPFSLYVASHQPARLDLDESDASAEHLASELRRTFAPSPSLTEAVTDYVLAQRDRGVPPERMLIALKVLYAQATLGQRYASGFAGTRNEQDPLREYVITMAIKRYFDRSRPMLTR